MLGQVHGHDAEGRERGLTPDERLRLHQDRSGPVMEPTTWVAGGAVSRAADGAELWAGAGDHVSAAPLASLNVVPPQSRGPIDNKARRFASQERFVLSQPERRRSVICS
jgi:hypothetical protein